jgi:hypothetical protein
MIELDGMEEPQARINGEKSGDMHREVHAIV